VRRCRFLRHASGRQQLYLNALRGARVEMSDSLVANGRGGVDVFASAGRAILTNLTVAHNERWGIQGQALDGRVDVYNTIAYGNPLGDLVLSGADVFEGANLVGEDPLFIDPEGDYFGLHPGSPAIDAAAGVPPGGLGPMDLVRQPRVYNTYPDIGAIEWRP
jgi:hypothetical protein